MIDHDKCLRKAISDAQSIVSAKQVVRCSMKDAVKYADFSDIHEKLKSAHQLRYRHIV
jgi:hypothetical protein